MNPIKLLRAYECPDTPRAPGEYRVLVDRLWPRGITKERLGVDHWMKAIAPSAELRKAFGHDPARFPDFAERYCAELDANAELVAALRARLADGPLTLVYAARDAERNQARVLRDYLEAAG